MKQTERGPNVSTRIADGQLQFGSDELDGNIRQTNLPSSDCPCSNLCTNKHFARLRYA